MIKFRLTDHDNNRQRKAIVKPDRTGITLKIEGFEDELILDLNDNKIRIMTLDSTGHGMVLITHHTDGTYLDGNK